MMPDELAIPWRALAVPGLVPWRAVISGPFTRALTLGPHREGDEERHELLDLCAAVELDRVWPADLPRLAHAKKRSRWTWPVLMHGARGLAREDAPGVLAVGSALGRLGLRVEHVELWRGKATEVAA